MAEYHMMDGGEGVRMMYDTMRMIRMVSVAGTSM
jgi:hypothetical protein